MNRYVLKINDSTYVKKIDWLAMQIPIIDTDFFDNAEIYTEDYFNELNSESKTIISWNSKFISKELYDLLIKELVGQKEEDLH